MFEKRECVWEANRKVMKDRYKSANDRGRELINREKNGEWRKEIESDTLAITQGFTGMQTHKQNRMLCQTYD